RLNGGSGVAPEPDKRGHPGEAPPLAQDRGSRRCRSLAGERRPKPPARKPTGDPKAALSSSCRSPFAVPVPDRLLSDPELLSANCADMQRAETADVGAAAGTGPGVEETGFERLDLVVIRRHWTLLRRLRRPPVAVAAGEAARAAAAVHQGPPLNSSSRAEWSTPPLTNLPVFGSRARRRG